MTVSVPASTILSAHCFYAPCACHRFSASAAEEDLVKHSADDDKHVRAKKPSKPRTDLCLAGGLKSNPDSRDPNFICEPDSQHFRTLARMPFAPSFGSSGDPTTSRAPAEHLPHCSSLNAM